MNKEKFGDADVVRVKAKRLDPLSQFSDKDIPSQLDLKISELNELAIALTSEFDRKFPNILPQNKGVIRIGPEAENYFYMCEPPGRSVSSYYLDDEKDSIQYQKEVAICKGSGCLEWQKVGEFVDANMNRRYYPIIINENTVIDTRRVFGGEVTEFSSFQYFAGLVLNALIKRHNIPQAVIKPARLIALEELVVFENGQLKKVSFEEYCNTDFLLKDPEMWAKIPDFETAKNLSQFFYFGELCNLRVPRLSFKIDEQRYHSAGLLYDPKTDQQTIEDRVVEFAGRIANLLKMSHEYNITFTQEPEGARMSSFSSLNSSNVSMSGIVGDLDTVVLHRTNDYAKKLKEEDLRSAVWSVFQFSNLFELAAKEPKDSKMKYEISYQRHPTFGYAIKGLEKFHSIYPIPLELRIDVIGRKRRNL